MCAAEQPIGHPSLQTYYNFARLRNAEESAGIRHQLPEVARFDASRRALLIAYSSTFGDVKWLEDREFLVGIEDQLWWSGLEVFEDHPVLQLILLVQKFSEG